MKKYLFTAVLLCSCTLAFNQALSGLSGVVTDDAGEALIGATVELMGENYVIFKDTITDLDGNYAFKMVEPGMYNLEISYTGYQTTRVGKVDVKANKVHQLDVVLKTQHMGCGFVHQFYHPPLIDMHPGNTGIIYPANFLRNMY